MIKYLFFICQLSTLHSIAQSYSPVDNGSSVKFEIGNLGFDVEGTFKGLNGKMLFNEKDLASSFFHVSVNAGTINTENSTRDKHLKGESYFYVSRYPFITIVSTKLAKSTTPGYYVFFGKVTIKDKTQDISFPFTVTSIGDAYRFKAEFKIKRRDFDVGGKNTISNELKVKLDVLTKKN